MKKILSLIIIAAITFTSCKKDLNQVPISTTTTATFYKQPSDFVQGTNAIYNQLRGYPDRLNSLSEIRSDNIYGVTVAGREWDPINNFATGIAPNVYVEEAWSSDFNGIFRANTVLDQIVQNGSFVGSAVLATRLSAEAKFLRAFFYFDLVKYYGKVPVVEHPVSAAEAISIPRSPVTDVYALIIADLQFAITNLPANYSGAYPAYGAADIGRATKYAAEALLAKVYMTRSGPTYGIEGPGLGLSEWTLALPLLQDIITNGGFVFNPSYANIFSYANQSPAITSGNREAVFDVMYMSGQSPVLGATYVWGLTPQNYLTTVGATLNSAGSLEIIPVTPNLINAYDPADVRKGVTVFTAGYTFAGNTENRPFFKKWLDITKVPLTRFDWAENFIAIRYTDILMLKAECILHGAPGSQADVDGIVTQVRTRAGLGALSNVTLPQLFAERRLEFANEGQRWFDLQRSGDLVTIMNAWKATDDAQNKVNNVVANYVIYPVPQTQMDAVPGLYIQNLGY
ncbi:MAG: RagB/SusD family nutrient uptake outer membrane protein [Chitinophagaceae bacterium]